MKYYVFKVRDSAGEEYYILNNQYIGYVGFDTNFTRSKVEYEKKITKKYQLYAESYYFLDNGADDQILHSLNCSSQRFNKKEIDQLLTDYYPFIKSRSRIWYRVYFPDRNSSVSYLRQIGGNKTIQ